MNKVTLSGYLANTPELRLIDKDNKSIYLANFILKVRKYSKNKENKSINYIPCVAWGNVAQNLAKYKQKNDFVTLSGKFFQRKITVKRNLKASNAENSSETERNVQCIVIFAQTVEWNERKGKEKLEDSRKLVFDDSTNKENQENSNKIEKNEQSINNKDRIKKDEKILEDYLSSEYVNLNNYSDIENDTQFVFEENDDLILDINSFIFEE